MMMEDNIVFSLTFYKYRQQLSSSLKKGVKAEKKFQLIIINQTTLQSTTKLSIWITYFMRIIFMLFCGERKLRDAYRFL